MKADNVDPAEIKALCARIHLSSRTAEGSKPEHMAVYKAADPTYRSGVGIMLLNRRNDVFVGQRIGFLADAWQMPQGGIEPREGQTRLNSSLKARDGCATIFPPISLARFGTEDGGASSRNGSPAVSLDAIRRSISRRSILNSQLGVGSDPLNWPTLSSHSNGNFISMF
jgi:hypothetical protein